MPYSHKQVRRPDEVLEVGDEVGPEMFEGCGFEPGKDGFIN